MDVALRYDQFTPPLTAGAFATHTTLIVCRADIEISKDADELSKVGDPVTYTFEIRNVGDVTVNRGTVTDTLLGDLYRDLPGHLDGGPVCRGPGAAHCGRR